MSIFLLPKNDKTMRSQIKCFVSLYLFIKWSHAKGISLSMYNPLTQASYFLITSMNTKPSMFSRKAVSIGIAVPIPLGFFVFKDTF